MGVFSAWIDGEKLKRNLNRYLYLLKVLAMVFVYQSVLWVFLYKFIPVYITPLMVLRGVEKIFEGKIPDVKKEWVAIDEMAPGMRLAVVASEDQHFLNHHGFDFDALTKAYQNNSNHTNTFRGGSTISQQVAKNVFLWPERSYLRKGFEAYFTILIELMWSKKRIMEVYLNVIEMGNEVYGTQAASKYYFKKPAKKLSVSQCARIAAILPNPRKWSPTKPSKYIIKRQTWIERHMNYIGKLTFSD